MKTITITPKEFATLTGYSTRHSQKLFTALRKHLGKVRNRLITREEAENYFNIKLTPTATPKSE